MEYPVKMPVGIHDLCYLYAKNIIVVAGSKGAGKTAFLLNVALLNQNDHEVIYFNSEMGDEEWTKRLQALGIHNKTDQKFKAWHRHDKFHERMDERNAIYIVDFMEIHDNFYEIAKPIRQIHEKLKDGICFIGIQMKRGGG